jgi:hypothetical protein
LIPYFIIFDELAELAHIGWMEGEKLFSAE